MRVFIYSIAILATCIFVMRYYDKPCPKQEGCNCISPREVLRINARYETYIDSLSYNGRKSQHKRYQDSIDKFNLILNP